MIPTQTSSTKPQEISGQFIKHCNHERMLRRPYYFTSFQPSYGQRPLCRAL